MNAFRRHPYFTAWIVLCVLLGGAAGWGWRWARVNGQRETRLASQLREEQDRLRAEIGAGETEEPDQVAQIVTTEGSSLPMPEFPESPLAAQIAMVHAQEEMRRQLTEAGVRVAADEPFGLGAFTRVGPARDELAQVAGHLALVRHAVAALAEAGAERLLNLKGESHHAGAGGVRKRGTDNFTLEACWEIRQPGLHAGSAVRVEVAGETETLRRFLRAIEATAGWVAVRRVAVAPSSDAVAAGKGSRVFQIDLVEARPVWSGAESIAMPEGISAQWVAGGALFDPPGRRPAAMTREMSGGRSDPAASVWNEPAPIVAPQPFRVQLAGMVAGTHGRRVVLLTTEGGEIRSARRGERLADLGLVLREVVWQQVTVPAPDDGALSRVVCEVAILWDERAAVAVALHPFAPTFTTEPAPDLALPLSP